MCPPLSILALPITDKTDETYIQSNHDFLKGVFGDISDDKKPLTGLIMKMAGNRATLWGFVAEQNRCRPTRSSKETFEHQRCLDHPPSSKIHDNDPYRQQSDWWCEQEANSYKWKVAIFVISDHHFQVPVVFLGFH